MSDLKGAKFQTLLHLPGDGEPRESAGHLRADHGGRAERWRQRRRLFPLPRHAALNADLQSGTEVCTVLHNTGLDVAQYME